MQQVVDRRDLLVEAGGLERRRLVADDHRTAAALGLLRLADVVGDVRIGDRNVAHRQHRRIEHRQAALLARQPLLHAVRAEMHEGVGRMLAARPQVDGEEVVRRPLLHRVVERLLLVVALPGARRLRQDRDVAQLQPRDREELATVAAQDHRRARRIAPVLVDRVLHLGGQRRQPRAILGHRQQRGEPVVDRRLDAAFAIRRLEQTLQLRQQLVLAGRHRGRVSVGLQRGQRREQAARHVQERGRQVLLAGRVVPEEDRDPLVRRGLALQGDELHRLADDRGSLLVDRDDRIVFLARGGGDLDLGDAGVLGLREVERNVHQRHALLVGAPLGLVAAAIGHRLDHRDAERLELGAPSFRVEHDLRVDQHVGEHAIAALQQRRRRVGIHHRAVDRQCRRAGGLDARDQVVDERGLQRCDVLLVQRDRDDRRALRRRRIDALPRQIGERIGEDEIRCLRVVDRALGKHDRIGDADRLAAGQVRGERGEEAVEVRAPAVVVEGDQAPGERLGQLPPCRALLVEPGVRQLQPGQRGGELAAHVVLQIGVEEHRIEAGEHARVDAGRQLVDVAHLHVDAVRTRDLLELVELARRHVAGRDEQHRRRLRGARPEGETGAQQQADDGRHVLSRHFRSRHAASRSTCVRARRSRRRATSRAGARRRCSPVRTAR
jgi:hypothetical protein